MGNENEKIIFALYPLKDDGYDRIESYVGLSSHIEKGIARCIGNRGKNISNKVKELAKEGNEGVYRYYDAIIFVLPLEIARLHTQQHPLIIMKNLNEVVDIDEYWYTPFKKIIFGSQKFDFTKDNENWRHDEPVDWALESGYLIRFKINSDDPEWLYAIKTNNITFDMDR